MSQHYTKKYSLLTTERFVKATDLIHFIHQGATRVINIPLEPGANHSDLPEDLRFLPEFKNGKPYKRYYRP